MRYWLAGSTLLLSSPDFRHGERPLRSARRGLVRRTLRRADGAAGGRLAHIAGGRDTLIAAPTGSGKTLAAFLWAIND